MKNSLSNRLLILFVIVASAAAIFGVIHLLKNRRVQSPHDSTKAVSVNPEVVSKPDTVENNSAQTFSPNKNSDANQRLAKNSYSRHRETGNAHESKEKGEMDREGKGEFEAISEESESGGRETWFYRQREYPLTTIPRMAISNAVAHAEREQTRLRSLRTAGVRVNGVPVVPDTLPPWQSLGPKPIAAGQTFGNGPVSGRVTAIALDPGYDGNSNKTVYVGGAQGGVWRSTDNGTNWTPIMDDQPSIAIGAIAIDPTNPNVIYVGTGEPNFSGDSYYGAGLLKTTDGGANWTQIKGPASPTDPTIFGFMNVVFPRLAIDPTSPSTIYAVTNANGHTAGASGGRGPVIVDKRGIWKSTDGGVNWINLDPPTNGAGGGGNSGTDVLIDPRRPNRIFAAIQSVGVFQSDAGGAAGSWHSVTGDPLPIPVADADPPTFLRVILASGPPISPSTETTIYSIYAAGNGNSILGIFRSTDGGGTWKKLTNPPVSGQTNYNLALAVDPTNANTLFYATNADGTVTGGIVWRSTDGGQTWVDMSHGDGVTGGVHPDSHVLLFCPTNHNILFTGNDGGIWRTDNALASPLTWRDLNSTLSLTQFQSLALHPTDPNKILGGTQDNGTNLYSGQASWNLVQGGDGGFTLIDQANPLVMYHTFFNVNNKDGSAQIGPQISVSGGNGWQNRGCFGCSGQIGNFKPSDNVAFYAPMALNTGFTGQNTNVVYFGTNRLYRTADRGLTWRGLGASGDGFGKSLAPDFLVAGKTVLGVVTAIAAFPFSSSSPSTEIVWVGTNSGVVQMTTNAGSLDSATFTDVTRAPLPNRFVTDIAVDPANSQRAVLAFSGFNANTPGSNGHVFITNNQGTSWTDISGNLPDVPVTSIVIDPINANTYYIGTDIGVFRTTDGGTTWEALLNGMPKVAVFMLRYHAATQSLVAATHGRGMYRLDVSSEAGNPIPIVSSIQPTSAAVQGAAFTLTVNGSNFVPGATVLWNGQSRTTTFVNSSQLTTQIPATDLVTAGTATVTVSNPAPGGGTSTTSATFTIIKANQTISFGALGNKTFGNPPFTVSAIASSGLAVTFSIASGPATISGNTVTLTGVGTVTVRASQAGNANFNAAANVDQSFVVAKSNQTITFGTLANKTFGDAPFNVSATASSGLAVSFSVVTGNATINGSTVTINGTGTVTIRADQAGDANFNAAPPVQQTFTVNRGAASINLSNFVQIFDGTPKSVTATTTPLGLSGLTITYAGSPTPPSAIGRYPVVASLNNPNFQASNSIGNLDIIGLSPINSQSVNPGGQNTATVNPSGSNPGISANLNHTNSGVSANVSVGIYSGNPTERGLVNANGGFVNVKVTSANAGDTVVINYYYPNTVTAVNEAALQLYYFKGFVWTPVKGSGNAAPVKNTTDNLDGTVSGGRFTVTLDNTSSPKVSELTGTVFSATTALMGDINGDGVTNVNDLILMANILAGNFTPTQVQKDAADVLKDANNNITVGDLITLANFLAGNTKTLPLGN